MTKASVLISLNPKFIESLCFASSFAASVEIDPNVSKEISASELLFTINLAIDGERVFSESL